jgi:hypothetical protein
MSSNAMGSNAMGSDAGNRGTGRERSRRAAPAANRPVADTAQNEPPPAPSREALIATAAYYRAERRGFLPGHEQEDWLAAEREIDRR